LEFMIRNGIMAYILPLLDVTSNKH
jgi:hypothetical protein